jgi:hypothetical protein
VSQPYACKAKACWTAPTFPAHPPAGLSEDTPQLELPRFLRGVFFAADHSNSASRSRTSLNLSAPVTCVTGRLLYASASHSSAGARHSWR